MSQCNLFPSQAPNLLVLEQQAGRQGFLTIAGVDEAGRGPLAGPVTAAAVILPIGLVINGVNDSKKLSSAIRDRLYDEIITQAHTFGIGMASPELIDRINILQATRYAMLQAVAALTPQPDYILIDGITPIETQITQKTVKKGDSLSHSIAAASILAKVTRDRLMIELDTQYPGYGFAGHKGYGSSAHLDAIRRLGPSPVHRLTFAGVKEHVTCPFS